MDKLLIKLHNFMIELFFFFVAISILLLFIQFLKKSYLWVELLNSPFFFL